MKAIIQRVYNASVWVDDTIFGSIKHGLLVYVGVAPKDTDADVAYIVRKILQMRIYPFGEKQTQRTVVETGGSLLIVSQFTLFGSLQRGNRPDFSGAATPEKARKIYDQACALCAETLPVETGLFGAYMQLSYINDGPFTILLESDHLAHHKEDC